MFVIYVKFILTDFSWSGVGKKVSTCHIIYRICWHSWRSLVPDLQLHQCLHLLSPPSLRHRRSHQCWDLLATQAGGTTKKNRCDESSKIIQRKGMLMILSMYVMYFCWKTSESLTTPVNWNAPGKLAKQAASRNGGCRGCKNNNKVV